LGRFFLAVIFFPKKRRIIANPPICLLKNLLLLQAGIKGVGGWKGGGILTIRRFTKQLFKHIKNLSTATDFIKLHISCHKQDCLIFISKERQLH